MSYIGLVGDCHFRASPPIERVDEYVVVQYQKIRQAFDHFKEIGVQAVIAPGDIFNNYGRDTYDVLYSVIDLLKEYGLPLYTVFGQHDIRFHNLEVKDTPLQILIKSHLTWPLGRKPTMLPYDNGVWLWGASFGEPLFALPKKHGNINIMVVHHMVLNGKKLWPGQTNYSQAKTLGRRYKFDLFVCGDNHNAFVNDKVLNCGSLMRMRIDQAEHRPIYGIYNTRKRELETFEYNIAPSEKVLHNYDVTLGNMKKMTEEQKKAFMESLSTDFEGGVDYKQNIHEVLRTKRRVRKRTRQIIEEAINE